MTTSAPFIILRKPCEEAVTWAASCLEQTGFRTVRTFDLQTARLGHLDYPCPHHGSSPCDCQMVVLLVYQADFPPATLVIHGSDVTSYIYLTNMPQQPAGAQLGANIRAVFEQVSQPPSR